MEAFFCHKEALFESRKPNPLAVLMAHGNVWQMEVERGGAECQGCGGVEVSHPTSRVSTPLQLLSREAQVSTSADVPRGMITWTF